jgi:hypothetical protein
MSRADVINHVTLDGVMQAPGRPDEDRRGASSTAAGRCREATMPRRWLSQGSARGEGGLLAQLRGGLLVAAARDEQHGQPAITAPIALTRAMRLSPSTGS